MRFAELTQEVQVARPQQPVFDSGLTPGRRRMKIQRQQDFKLTDNGNICLKLFTDFQVLRME